MDNEIRVILEDVITDYVNNHKMFTAYDVTVESTKKAVRESKILKIRHFDVKGYIHKFLLDNLDSFGYSRSILKLKGITESPFVYYPDGSDPNDYQIIDKNNNKNISDLTGRPLGLILVKTNKITQDGLVDALNEQKKNSAKLGQILIGLRFINQKELNDALCIQKGDIQKSTQKTATKTAIVSPDKRGRIWIPSDMISAIGLDFKQKAYVHVLSDRFINMNFDPSESYIVVTKSIFNDYLNDKVDLLSFEYQTDRHLNIAISEYILENVCETEKTTSYQISYFDTDNVIIIKPL